MDADLNRMVGTNTKSERSVKKDNNSNNANVSLDGIGKPRSASEGFDNPNKRFKMDDTNRSAIARNLEGLKNLKPYLDNWKSSYRYANLSPGQKAACDLQIKFFEKMLNRSDEELISLVESTAGPGTVGRSSSPKSVRDLFPKLPKKEQEQITIKELAELIEEDEENVFKIPDHVESSQLSIVARSSLNDNLQFVPKYATYKSRLLSFKNLEGIDIEEVKFLSKVGFYFLASKSYKYVFMNLHSGSYDYVMADSVACFSCCSTAPICNMYPRPKPVDHYHYCSLELPQNLKYLKDPVQPRKQDLDIDFIKKRAEPLPVPKCKCCHERESSIEYWPCQHSNYCTFCAKTSDKCLDCGVVYSGIVKKW